MHRCLFIKEILSIVFENLFDDTSGPTIAALAMTCRVFSEPALDLLWREVESLSVLLRCMPSDLWTLSEVSEEVDAVEYPMLTFTRPLTEADWVRFEHHAARVRIFGCSMLSNLYVGVHKSAWLVLCMYRPVKTLLPKLHSLIMELRYNTFDIPFLPALLVPGLRQICIGEIKMNMAAQDIDSLCISALRLCPNINAISMDVNEHMPTSFFDLIGSLTCLTHVVFRTTTLSKGTSKRLSQHPNLRQLCSVRISKSTVSHFTTASGRFPSLEEFACKVPNWATAVTLMRQMQRYFKSLTIYSNQREDVGLSSVSELTRAIDQHPSISSLTKLKLYCPSKGSVDKASNSGIFEPLFRCTALQELDLYFHVISTLDDAWLLKASIAWPFLHSIRLVNLHPEKPRMTLAGLIPLAKRCPDLRELNLAVHASPVDPSLLDGVCNPKVKILSLRESTINSPGKVVHSLVRLFPHVKCVSHAGASGEHTKGWVKVNKILHSITH